MQALAGVERRPWAGFALAMLDAEDEALPALENDLALVAGRRHFEGGCGKRGGRSVAEAEAANLQRWKFVLRDAHCRGDGAPHRLRIQRGRLRARLIGRHHDPQRCRRSREARTSAGQSCQDIGKRRGRCRMRAAGIDDPCQRHARRRARRRRSDRRGRRCRRLRRPAPAAPCRCWSGRLPIGTHGAPCVTRPTRSARGRPAHGANTPMLGSAGTDWLPIATKPAVWSSSIHSRAVSRGPTGKSTCADLDHQVGRMPRTMSQKMLGAGSAAISGAWGRSRRCSRPSPSPLAASSLSASMATAMSKTWPVGLSTSDQGTQRSARSRRPASPVPARSGRDPGP